MTTRTPTGETPFRLTYGSEAVIPAEVGLTSYRVHNHDENKNGEAMRLQLDLVDEIRAAAKQGSLGTRTAWPNTTTLGSDTETSKLEISFLERSYAPLETLPKESSAPIEKDLTELRRGRGKTLTTWRR